MKESDVLQFQANIQEFPVDFITDSLGSRLWSKQRKIVNSAFRHAATTARSCHASGKSYTAARAGLSFLMAYEDSIVVTTAPTFRQVENVIWREWRGAVATSHIPLGGKCLKTRHDISENWYAIGLSSDKPDKVQGLHAKSGHILVIVDEADGIPPEILQVLQGILTSQNAHLLLIGNPVKNYGGFYDSYSKDSSIYNSIKITAFDTPNFIKNGIRSLEQLKKYSREELMELKLPYPMLVTPVWVHDRLQDWGEDSPIFQSRVMAEAPDEGDDQLLRLSWLENSIHKEITKKEWKDRPRARCVGIDVARFGSDDTVLIGLDHQKMVGCASHNGKDTMKTVGRAIKLFKELGFSKKFDFFTVDDTGVGGGVTDRLVELGYEVIAVDYASSPSEDNDEMPLRFENLKAEIFWDIVRKQFLQGDIKIMGNQNKLLGHLLSVKFDYTSKGKLIIVSKKKVKKKGGKSPDWADALAIAMYGISARGVGVNLDPEVGAEYNKAGGASSLNF